ncbi:aromatic amino acid hydroxylase [Bacteroidota bacterium]
MNEILERLPKHLLSLVIDQPYNSYTAQDHAVWRYVMRQNVDFLGKTAHGSYMEGLKKTGISIDTIPHMYGMNRILKEIGWAAVAVDGFIPPSAFMEFQAYKVLVIAADIRPVDQIGYTSAPDIIHEAAGHAPIIADPLYAQYLKRFGEIGSKAFASAWDHRMYEAIRHLSILKADPYSEAEKVAEAEQRIEEMGKEGGEPSELAMIRNLHWWTVEYGLVGEMENPKIYGAGLLSSIEESSQCLKPAVKKIPYSLDAANYSFDITEPQPQLFVTPDFETLSRVLEEFAYTMALRTGGVNGIRKAIASEYTATCEYSSGLQVSGIFTRVIEKNNKPVYLNTSGPTSLCVAGKEVPGQGKTYHSQGFGSPVGKLGGLARPLEDFSVEELGQLGITEGERGVLVFESGLQVSGILKSVTTAKGRPAILSFSDCTVAYEGETLFDPSWGIYDMAVGEQIVSAFAGPADPDAFGLTYPVPAEKTHKIHHSEEAKRLHLIYQKVRDIREKNSGYETLPQLLEELKAEHPGDWLCALEIQEINSEF